MKNNLNIFNESENKRNYGIDLLRVVSIFYVIILHVLDYGGILANTINNSLQYKLVWFIEICSYGAVNIFALISGYVSYSENEKKIKISSYLKLWLQVVFYNLLFTFLFGIIKPGEILFKDYIIAFFPVTFNLYWYFTAYTGLFIIMPFLNSAIRNCDKKTLKMLFFTIIIFFSFYDNISKRFNLAEGYSFIWLTLLFILGSIIKKCEIGKNLKIFQLLLGIIVLDIITFLYKIYGIKFSWLGISINKGFLISYISPTILIVSILHIILFSKLSFNKTMKEIITFIATSVFATYLINNNKFIWKYVIKGLFVNLCNQNIIEILFYVLGFSEMFLIISILIDKIRLLLFKIFKIDKLLDKLDYIYNKMLDKVINVD